MTEATSAGIGEGGLGHHQMPPTSAPVGVGLTPGMYEPNASKAKKLRPGVFFIITTGGCRYAPLVSAVSIMVWLLSFAYKVHEIPNWRRLEMHLTRLAFSLALDNAGNSMAARIAMIAMTTSNSMSVNARFRLPDKPL